MENLEVVTIAQSSDGEFRFRSLYHSLLMSVTESKRSSPSLLARQLRLRLVAAEDSDIPRNLSNIIVSIHAIATFQALHDYLRPRVAGVMSGSSRLSGMLAALAASGLAASSSSRLPIDDPPKPPSPPAPGTAVDGLSLSRRRSLRLSSKVAARDGASGGGVASAVPAQAEAGPSSSEPVIPLSAPAALESSEAPPPEGAPSDTVVNEDELDYEGEFTDEDVDVDAEVSYTIVPVYETSFDTNLLQVIDEDGDQDPSAADRTITVSVGEGITSFLSLTHSVVHGFSQMVHE